MPKSYSLTEMRNHFAEIVHEAEQEAMIQRTRHGKPFAVLLSAREYERLQKGKVNFWEAYLTFREQHNLAELDLDIDTIFADVRDRSLGRDIDWELP